VRQVGHLLELYRDARSAEHEINPHVVSSINNFPVMKFTYHLENHITWNCERKLYVADTDQ
jgi:hypothetical protein